MLEVFGNDLISPSWAVSLHWDCGELGPSPSCTKSGGWIVTTRSRQSLAPHKLTFCFPNDLLPSSCLMYFGWLWPMHFVKSSLPASCPSCRTPDLLSLAASGLPPCKLVPEKGSARESHSYLPDSPFTGMHLRLAHLDLADWVQILPAGPDNQSCLTLPWACPHDSAVTGAIATLQHN